MKPFESLVISPSKPLLEAVSSDNCKPATRSLATRRSAPMTITPAFPVVSSPLRWSLVLVS
jgi:hypothetical protein